MSTLVTGPRTHPGEIACDGVECGHGPACRAFPCVDCGTMYHHLGLIERPPFLCWTCEDIRWAVKQQPLLDLLGRRPELAEVGHGFVRALGVSAC